MAAAEDPTGWPGLHLACPCSPSLPGVVPSLGEFSLVTGSTHMPRVPGCEPSLGLLALAHRDRCPHPRSLELATGHTVLWAGHSLRCQVGSSIPYWVPAWSSQGLRSPSSRTQSCLPGLFTEPSHCLLPRKLKGSASSPINHLSSSSATVAQDHNTHLCNSFPRASPPHLSCRPSCQLCLRTRSVV